MYIFLFFVLNNVTELFALDCLLDYVLAGAGVGACMDVENICRLTGLSSLGDHSSW